jgi:hypothetical protein
MPRMGRGQSPLGMMGSQLRKRTRDGQIFCGGWGGGTLRVPIPGLEELLDGVGHISLNSANRVLEFH